MPGGRVLGHTDATGAAAGWDPTTGAADAAGEPVSTPALAAGLLWQVGLDPAAALPGVPVLRALDPPMPVS
jgi:hypothetical protein